MNREVAEKSHVLCPSRKVCYLGLPMRPEDARTAPHPWYSEWVTPYLNDPRDAVMVGLMAECAVLAAMGVSLFFVGPRVWLVAPLYWLLLGLWLLDRFTLMLHCTSHRPLFKPRYRVANWIIPRVLGPFFGHSPTSYFVHHMGMHHPEENLEGDLSSTMRFQRDKFSHWLRYYARFLFLILHDLPRYLEQHGRDKLKRQLLVGEYGYLVFVALLFAWKPGATFTVFVFPLLLIRTLMMMGNWGQHAFIAREHPDDAHLASITCINTRYNRRCFNDGYHIGHHLMARAHWTEYPVEFEQNIDAYAQKDAIVFEGIDFFQVWVLLMTGRWSRLARAFVRLPGAPARSDAEVIALLKERVKAF